MPSLFAPRVQALFRGPIRTPLVLLLQARSTVTTRASAATPSAMGKRKASEAAAGDDREAARPSKKAGTAPSDGLVNPKRVRVLKAGDVGQGPVVFWMSRDQRMKDNWALLYAIERAQQTGAPVAVVFNLVTAFLGAGARQFGFMLRGLRELQPRLKAKGVEFFLLQGDPAATLPPLLSQLGAGLLVTDYSPLRLGRQWRQQVCDAAACPVHEVDAHNIVPVWVASEKREVGARTLRPKIHKALPEYLREFPEVPEVPAWSGKVQPAPVEWDALIADALARGAAVPEVDWCKPGEDAALDALLGPKGFLTRERLGLYDTKRNDPACGNALSHLSPYLHFGQLAPQRAALEAAKHRSSHKAAVESFLEELVVRRELSDNFCHYAPHNYDSLACAAEWARESLNKHRTDKREFLYTRAQLEAGSTHDELWNACQLQMVHMGKMHGYMRMYWAKKILEWTQGPEEAIEIAIYLNDKYELDGRDPSGYVGVMWSMAGIHDMGWTERPIFGKIRYMNYNGCKRKFDIRAYCSYVDRAVAAVKAKAAAAPVPAAAARGTGAGTSGAGAGGTGPSTSAAAANALAAVAPGGAAVSAAAAAEEVVAAAAGGGSKKQKEEKKKGAGGVQKSVKELLLGSSKGKGGGSSSKDKAPKAPKAPKAKLVTGTVTIDDDDDDL